MNTTIASDHQMQRPKRVRLDPTATMIPDKSSEIIAKSSKVPKAAASASISAHTATLLQPLASVMKTIGDKRLDLLHRHYNKALQLSRLKSDESIIPRSCRLKFELSAEKAVLELPDFIKLSDDVTSDIEKMKTQLRLRITQALEIQVNFYRFELGEHLAKALHTATTAMLISAGDSTINAHRAVAHLLSSYSAELLKHSHIEVEAFKTLYAKVHTLATFPQLNDTSTTPSTSPISPYFSQQSTQSTTQVDPPDDIPNLDIIYRTVCCILISPYDRYLQQHQANDIDLQMKKLIAENLTVDATIDAQMAVEQEDSASRTLLNELVRNETRKHTHDLTAQIESLKHTITSLKATRGHKSTPGASTKRNASTKTTKQKANAKSVAAPVKDSSKNRRQKQPKKLPKSKNTKKRASTTRRNK